MMTDEITNSGKRMILDRFFPLAGKTLWLVGFREEEEAFVWLLSETSAGEPGAEWRESLASAAKEKLWEIQVAEEEEVMVCHAAVFGPESSRFWVRIPGRLFPGFRAARLEIANRKMEKSGEEDDA